MQSLKTLAMELCRFSPRQLEGEKRTATCLKQMLVAAGIQHDIQRYRLQIPFILSAELFVNGERHVPPQIEGSAFVSGDILPDSPIIDSRGPSADGNAYGRSILACNPDCPAPSQANFYRVPAIAISPALRAMIEENQANFTGRVDVEMYEHISENILVGNAKDPRSIVLTHYDSIKRGALDNASGVAVVMACMLRYRERLSETLFALCGSEELSHDEPFYGGYGYRVAEDALASAFELAESIHVVDSVGNRPPKVIEEREDNSSDDQALFNIALLAASPLRHRERWRKKIRIYGGDDIPQGMFTVYHSDLDDGSLLHDAFLEQTLSALNDRLTGQ